MPNHDHAKDEPYRYAGKKWWKGDFKLGGIIPGWKGWDARSQDWRGSPEPGFEEYHSVKYIKDHLKGKGEPDPPRLLDTPHMNELLEGPTDIALRESLEMINRWMQDMTAWAKAAREDLLALEAEIGKERGDTGDPPPVPWK